MTVEPTRIVPYNGREIRLYVRGPIFKELLFSASYEIVQSDKTISGSVTGAFKQAIDAESAALKEAMKTIEKDERSQDGNRQ